jgi:5-methylcytosine-specific restriction endonuclease McrA
VTHYLEEDLLIPALEVLRDNPGGLTMTQLIAELERRMRPTGADLVATGTRADSRFSQEVRNLESHKTLRRGGKVVHPVPRGPYTITAAGIAFLEDDAQLHDALKAQGTRRSDLKREYRRDYSEVIVEEGLLSERKSRHRTRSRILRREAVRESKRLNGGKLICAACDFEFEVDYGVLGRDYIEMHHTKPLHTSDVTRARVEDALRDGRLVPLCANCHRMAHKKRPGAYTVTELRRARTTKALP